ncbi:MAG: hemolysin III family protein [Clostridiaceae bacterium]|jgi:hemolysin III|nr:hemolysin III family protein [Clostridiaceae bacterium]
MSEDKNYTPAEEFANAFSHAIGAMFAIYAIVMLAVTSSTPLEKATTAVYGSMMFILFQASTCYHAITNKKAKKVFRKIDHSAIYLLIAGTYTPILMIVVKFPISVALLAITWYLAITGIVFSCLTLKFKYLSTGLYLLMGWLAMFFARDLWLNFSHNAIWFLLLGGLFYTFGSIFYLSKKKFMHSIWHLCVLGGAVAHYFCILTLIK